MSRGLGEIERHILDEVNDIDRLTGEPFPVLISSYAIVCTLFRPAYGWEWEPTMAQTKSVSRAMRSFARKFPRYALCGGKGRKRLYLYEPGDPVSAMWAKLTIEPGRQASLDDARAAVAAASVPRDFDAECAEADRQAAVAQAEAERAQAEADRLVEAAAAASEAAHIEAEAATARAEAASAELDRQRAEIMSELADKRRKEAEAVMAGFDALRRQGAFERRLNEAGGDPEKIRALVPEASQIAKANRADRT